MARSPAKAMPTPRAAPRRGEQAAFDDRLPEQTPASRAQRRADGKFLAPRLGAREEQRRQVGARDEQDEDDRALQHPHGGRRRCRRRASVADQYGDDDHCRVRAAPERGA